MIALSFRDVAKPQLRKRSSDGYDIISWFP